MFVHDTVLLRGVQPKDMIQTKNAGMKPAQSCVRIIPISEWAKFDVASYNFYGDMYEHPSLDDDAFLNIEKSPIVQGLPCALGRDICLWVSYDGAIVPVRIGTLINIPYAAQPTSQVGSSEWLNARSTDPEQCVPPLHKDVTNREHFVYGTTAGSWMVTGSDTPTGYVHHMSHTKGWTVQERALKTALCTPSTGGDVQVEVFPGDVCVVIRPAGQPSRASVVCLLVASLVHHARGRSSERLVWMDVEQTDVGLRLCNISSAKIIDMPEWNSTKVVPPDDIQYGRLQNRGMLPDGTRYIVYRVAFYTDGFKQTKAHRVKRSVGGCYMLPLGLSYEIRRKTGAPRVLNLAPSSVSHNAVMNLLMEDICRAAVRGVEGVDPYGRHVRIFVEPVTFLADYPAASLCDDVYGHQGNYFCTNCVSTKRRAQGCSQIVGLPMNHSRRIGLKRTDIRMAAIRSGNLRPNDYAKLVMNMRTAEKAEEKNPLALLFTKLIAARRDNGEPACTLVAPVMFDSHQSCEAVPYHLINGLIKNTLIVIFVSLEDDARHKRMEQYIIRAARANGMPVSGILLRFDRTKGYMGLMPQTMSTIMCVMLPAATALDIEFRRTGNLRFRLARSLLEFIAAVYYWPARGGESTDQSSVFTSEGRAAYYGRLRSLLKECLRQCDCVYQENQTLGKILDKPNAHCEMELVVHTIPTFWHVLNTSEIVFESIHQRFKDWLERNVHSTSHISGVERTLTKNWLGRVYSMYKCWKNGDSQDRACAEVSLRRLFVGEEGMRCTDPITEWIV